MSNRYSTRHYSSSLRIKSLGNRNRDNTFELVIFDLDDTLLANREATLLARDAALCTLFGNNLRPQERAMLMEKWQRLGWFFGPEERMIILTVLAKEKELSGSIKDQVKRAEQHFENVFISNIKPIPGAFRLLADLTEAGLKVALISNGIAKTQLRKLRKTGLTKYFLTRNTIISPETSLLSKPHPFPIRKICHNLSITPEKTLAVGDRVSDVVAANLAGCCSVLFNRNNLQVKKPNSSKNLLRVEVPYYSIHTLNQLRNIIGISTKVKR